MAKYEYVITITPPAEATADDPTLEEVRAAVLEGVEEAFPAADVSVNAGNRPDID